MRKHVLFLVHGMGDNVNADGSMETNWAANAEATLKTLYDGYQIRHRAALAFAQI